MCRCNNKQTDFEESTLYTKRILWLDLLLKALFVAYFPAPITALCCIALSIPSALALIGIYHGKGPIWHYPALVHHIILYLLPLGILTVAIVGAVVSSGKWSEPPRGSDPAQACSTWLDYTGEDFKPRFCPTCLPYRELNDLERNDRERNDDLVMPKLKVKCNFPVPFNPFWYKGDVPMPKCSYYSISLPNARQFGISPYATSVNTVASCAYVQTLNEYQQNLTIGLVVAASFVFIAWHIHQMIRFIRHLSIGNYSGGGNTANTKSGENPSLLPLSVGD